MKGLHIVFWILLVIGGLNWLLVGVAGWDVGVLFGGQDAIIAELFGHKKNCSACKSGSDMSAPM